MKSISVKDLLLVGLLVSTLISVSMVSRFSKCKKESDNIYIANYELTGDSLKIKLHLKYLEEDINQFFYYNYIDSIHRSEFDGKSQNGYWFRTKGKYYVKAFEDNDGEYLHRVPTWEGFLEFITIKYTNYIEKE